MTPGENLRLQRGAAHLHTLGPRAVAELLMEVARTTRDVACILTPLEEYGRRLTPRLIQAVGGTNFPRRLRVVPTAYSPTREAER